MKPGTRVAVVVLGVSTVALLGYEAWSVLNDVEGDTLSQGVWSIIDRFPVFLFFAGFLCGHWFWPRKVRAHSDG